MSGSTQLTVTGLPVIEGDPAAGFPLSDLQPLNPLATVTVSDSAGGTDSATATLTDASGNPTDANGTLSGPGVTRTGAGTYSIAGGSAAALTAALQQAVFTPTPREVAPNQSVTTDLSLAVTSSLGGTAAAQTVMTVSASTTSAQASAVPATESTTGSTPLRLFPSVGITDNDNTPLAGAAIVLSDTNANRTDANGTVSGPGLTETATGIYQLDATDPATLQQELRGVTFTPARTAGGSVVTNVELQIFDGYSGLHSIGSNGLIPPENHFTTLTVTPDGGAADSPSAGSGAVTGTTGETIAFAGGGAASQIALLYQAALGRAPDEAGLSYWAAEAQSGTSLSTIAQQFTAAPEFQARFGTPDNAGFITEMYEKVLGRAPDAAGQSYWQAQMDQGGLGRGDVLLGFSQSTENKAGATAAAGGEVFRLYDTALGRAPDAAGLAYWTQGLTSGRQTLQQEAASFMQSPEFQQGFGTPDNAAFVNDLYVNALGRPADDQGAAYWAQMLNTGAISRAGAVVSFSESPEHQALVAPQIAQSGVIFTA